MLGPEEAGLWLKKKTLAGESLRVIVDASFKPLLPKSRVLVDLLRVTAFDGLSLRSLEPKNWRTAITIKGDGKVSQRKTSPVVPIEGEDIEVGMRAVGLGAGVSAVKLGEKLLRRSGLIQHNDTSGYNALLGGRGQHLGRARYVAYIHYSLKSPTSLVRRVVPKEDLPNLRRKPIIASHSLIEIDLANAPINPKLGAVEVSMRENTDITELSRDHARPVVLTTWYEADVRALDEAGRDTDARLYRDKLMESIGPMRYEPIAGATKQRKAD